MEASCSCPSARGRQSACRHLVLRNLSLAVIGYCMMKMAVLGSLAPCLAIGPGGRPKDTAAWFRGKHSTPALDFGHHHPQQAQERLPRPRMSRSNATTPLRRADGASRGSPGRPACGYALEEAAHALIDARVAATKFVCSGTVRMDDREKYECFAFIPVGVSFSSGACGQARRGTRSSTRC
jgi:hypothetical protein